MSQCDAFVVEVRGQQVWVEVPARTAACEHCRTPEVCREGLLGLSAGPRRYRMENRIGARVGDRVRLSVADGTLWRASLLSYVLPVVLAIAGAAIGQSIGADAWAIAGTVAGLTCGLVVLRRHEMRARAQGGGYVLQIETNDLRIKEQ